MSETLGDIRQRAGAATKGPWETTQAADEESTTWIEARSGDILHHDERGHGHMRENFAWMKRADAEFIAHARTDMPRLLAALDAVLALHQPIMENCCASCDWDVRGNNVWPCATVAAVNDALEATK